MNLKLLLIIPLALCIAAINAIDVVAQTPTKIPLRKIAFISTRDGWPAPYMMNSDGSDQQPLREKLEWVFTNSITWSPDGKEVAFENRFDERGTCEIVVVDIISQQSRTIPIDQGDVSTLTCDAVHWLPDGNHIAFISNRTGIFQLYTVIIDKQELSSVTNDLLQDEYFSWSPKGDYVLIYSIDYLKEIEPRGFYRVSLSDKKRIWLFEATSFRWLPNGKEFIYTIQDKNEFFICTGTIASDLSSCINQPDNIDLDTNIDLSSVSSDGKSILFTAGTKHNTNATDRFGDNIYITASNFKNIHQLTVSFENGEIQDNFSPGWSPDNQFILYVKGNSGLGGAKDIYVMDADGNNKRRLTFDTNSHSPVWQP